MNYDIGDRVAGKINDQDWTGIIDKILFTPDNIRKLQIRLDQPILTENGRWVSLLITTEEPRKLPNTHEEIQNLLNEMHAHDGDDEQMHSLRDRILHTALTAIVEQPHLDLPTITRLAALALQTDNFEFREWSA